MATTKKSYLTNPKRSESPEQIELDVRNRAINHLADLLAEWEYFMMATETVPDVVVMKKQQYQFLLMNLRDRANRLGWKYSEKAINSPKFMGASVIVR